MRMWETSGKYDGDGHTQCAKHVNIVAGQQHNRPISNGIAVNREKMFMCGMCAAFKFIAKHCTQIFTNAFFWNDHISRFTAHFARFLFFLRFLIRRRKTRRIALNLNLAQLQTGNRSAFSRRPFFAIHFAQVRPCHTTPNQLNSKINKVSFSRGQKHTYELLKSSTHNAMMRHNIRTNFFLTNKMLFWGLLKRRKIARKIKMI